MKNKSLVIISFAFIFLLSMSIVSAGIFSRKTGNALRDVQPIEPISPLEPVSEPSGLRSIFYSNDGQLFGLFGPSVPTAPIAPIDISPAPTRPSIDTGDEGESTTDFGNGDFGGGGCEFLEEEEAFLGLGEESFINGHIIYLDEEGGLTVDDTYSYPPLREGGNYLVPIPNPECHWEASFEDGGLYMLTVCPLPEEFVE